MTYFYTYKITLLKGTLTGHYYYGQHKTSNLNDGYAGSGRMLLNYYKKYGKIEEATYVKEIINFYNSLDELNTAEAELIGDLYETDELCLNFMAGGRRPGYSEEYRHKLSEAHRGKTTWMKGKHHTEESKRKISEANKGKQRSEETKLKLSEVHKRIASSEEFKKKLSELYKDKKIGFCGKHHSEETKRKMSESHKGKNMLSRGKHWKLDPETNKRIWY